MLFGYFIDPFGTLLSSGSFTCILQNYFTDVLRLELTFLTTLQLFSTILIVGQLIERTKTMDGKARPWILLSALTIYLQFMFTRECVTEKIMASGAEESDGKAAETVSLSAQLKAVTGEKMWWNVILFYLVFQWNGGTERSGAECDAG